LKNWTAKVEKESKIQKTAFNYFEIQPPKGRKKYLKIPTIKIHLKESPKAGLVRDYLTATYLSTNHQQVVHNPLNWVKNAVLIIRIILFHLYT